MSASFVIQMLPAFYSVKKLKVITLSMTEHIVLLLVVLIRLSCLKRVSKIFCSTTKLNEASDDLGQAHGRAELQWKSEGKGSANGKCGEKGGETE